jgi:para-nitrobenzyl esterase
MRTLESAEQAGVEQADAAGASSAAALRALSADEVVRHLRSAGQIIDGYVTPEDPSDVFADGRQNPVDVLVGSNKEESFFPGGPDARQFEEQARERWGELADAYLAVYPHATDEEAVESSRQTFSDGAFWHMRLYAEYQRRRGQKAWLFLFAQEPPGPRPGQTLPATHATEVPYVFDNLGQLPLFPDRSIPYYAARSEPDLLVADRMSSYWVNFARTGDPNGPGLPAWPAFSGMERIDAAILDADPASEKLPGLERMQVHDALYAHMRSN